MQLLIIIHENEAELKTQLINDKSKILDSD